MYQRWEKNSGRHAIKISLEWESIDYTELHLKKIVSEINNTDEIPVGTVPINLKLIGGE